MGRAQREHLAELLGDGRARFDRQRQVHRLGFEFVRLDQVVREPRLVRLFSAHEAPGHHQFHGLAPAEDLRQRPEAAQVRIHAALDVGHLEPRRRGADGQVAVARQVEAGADAGPVDHRDHWHLKASESDVGLGLVAEVQPIAFRVGPVRRWRLAIRVGASAHVHARAEAAAGPGDDNAPNRAVEAGVHEDLPQLPEQRERQCIELVRTVERQPQDAVLVATALLEHQVFIGHESSSECLRPEV